MHQIMGNLQVKHGTYIDTNIFISSFLKAIFSNTISHLHEQFFTLEGKKSDNNKVLNTNE